MSRSEREQYFEAIWRLRVTYAARGDEDRAAVLSIGEAVSWAEEQLATVPAGDAGESQESGPARA